MVAKGVRGQNTAEDALAVAIQKPVDASEAGNAEDVEDGFLS